MAPYWQSVDGSLYELEGFGVLVAPEEQFLGVLHWTLADEVTGP